MIQMRRTKKNLETAWQHLDDACGSLDNALMALEAMNIDSGSICLSTLVNLKEEVERLIQAKIKLQEEDE